MKTMEQVVATIQQKSLPIIPKNFSVLRDLDPLIELRVDHVTMRRLVAEGFAEHIYVKELEVDGHRFSSYRLVLPLSQLKQLKK